MYIQCDYKPVLNNIKPNQFVGVNLKVRHRNEELCLYNVIEQNYSNNYLKFPTCLHDEDMGMKHSERPSHHLQKRSLIF